MDKPKMDKQKMVPVLSLKSKNFADKVLLFLFKGGGIVNISLPEVPAVGQDCNEEVNNLLFVLQNARSSTRKKCTACGGYHWLFVKEFEQTNEKDSTCLCTNCGKMLPLLALFKVSEKESMKWILSKGGINPYELLRDAKDKMISNGELTMTKKDAPLSKHLSKEGTD